MTVLTNQSSAGESAMSTILIADDRIAGRDLVRVVLEGCGYKVCEAADGRGALKQARRVHPDLIILDLHMPDINGFKVIGALRGEADFISTPILALTASAMRGDRERAMSAGFTAYMSKPMRLPEFRNEVARLLAQASKRTMLLGAAIATMEAESRIQHRLEAVPARPESPLDDQA